MKLLLRRTRVDDVEGSESRSAHSPKLQLKNKGEPYETLRDSCRILPDELWPYFDCFGRKIYLSDMERLCDGLVQVFRARLRSTCRGSLLPEAWLSEIQWISNPPERECSHDDDRQQCRLQSRGSPLRLFQLHRLSANHGHFLESDLARLPTRLVSSLRE